MEMTLQNHVFLFGTLKIKGSLHLFDLWLFAHRRFFQVYLLLCFPRKQRSVIKLSEPRQLLKNCESGKLYLNPSMLYHYAGTGLDKPMK